MIDDFNEQYRGYRKVTCLEWQNNKFIQQLYDFHKKNGGINMLSDLDYPCPFLVIDKTEAPYYSSNTITSPYRFSIEIDESNTKYILQYMSVNKFTYRSPNVIYNSFSNFNINDHYKITCDKYHGTVRLSRINEVYCPSYENVVFPCLFVRIDSASGGKKSRRRKGSRKQKRGTRNH